MHLDDNLVDVFRILPAQAGALKRLGIVSVKDLLYHFPTRYGDTAQVTSVSNLKKGEVAVIFGRISGLKTSKAFRKKIPMSEGWVEDDSPAGERNKIKIVWFHQ